MNLTRDNQEPVIELANIFQSFYYDNLNNKNFEEIYKYLKEHTIFSSQNTKYSYENINEYFNYLNSINIRYYNITFDAIHSGSRRINLLVTGQITYLENSVEITKSFSEFIHFGSDNNKKYWIVLSMFKIL